VAPYAGVQAALAEALRDLACVGAELVAITDGLNMASPSDPQHMQAIAEVFAGLQAGLEQLHIPVTGGNVSLYNSSPAGAIPPTPFIGALGVIEQLAHVPQHTWQADSEVFLLGMPHSHPVWSHWVQHLPGAAPASAAPAVDLAAEQRLARFLCQQVHAGRVRSARSCKVGGWLLSLAKMCLQNGCGVRLRTPQVQQAATATPLDSPNAWLWPWLGEYAAMAWIGAAAADAPALLTAAAAAALPIQHLGHTGGTDLYIDACGSLALAKLTQAYQQAAQDL
jgi:phosphoribosylformylglycinamidine synthase